MRRRKERIIGRNERSERSEYRDDAIEDIVFHDEQQGKIFRFRPVAKSHGGENERNKGEKQERSDSRAKPSASVHFPAQIAQYGNGEKEIHARIEKGGIRPYAGCASPVRKISVSDEDEQKENEHGRNEQSIDRPERFNSPAADEKRRDEGYEDDGDRMEERINSREHSRKGDEAGKQQEKAEDPHRFGRKQSYDAGKSSVLGSER